MRKKVLALFLTSIMAVGMLAGCGQAEQEEKTEVSKTEESQKESASEDASESKEEFTTVKILCAKDYSADLKISDWDKDSEISKKFITDLEEIGVRLEVECIANDQYAQVIQTRLAAGTDLPDLIGPRGLSTADVLKLGDSGLLYDLNELLDQYDEDGSITAYMDSIVPGVWDSMKSPATGENYYFFNMWGDGVYEYIYEGETLKQVWSHGLMIRKDWVEKLGEEVKEVYTPDELIELFKKMQDADVNGNGVADEIAYLNAGGFYGLGTAFGLGSHTLANYSNDNKVFNNFYQEGFPAYIEFMNELYEQGLYVTECLNMSDSEMVAADRVAAIFRYNNWDYEASLPNAAEVTESIYVPVYVELDGDISNGVNVFVDTYAPCADQEYYVPKNAENPEGVIRLMDYIYSDKYAVFAQFGIEGYSYEKDANGDYIVKANDDRLSCFHAGGLGTFGIPAINVYPSVSNAGKLDYCAKDYLKAKYEWMQNFDKNVFSNEGNVFQYNDKYYALATVEEQEKLDEITASLETYANELLLELVLGEKSLDDLADYQKEMEEMGLLEYLDIMQARRNRYLGIE